MAISQKTAKSKKKLKKISFYENLTYIWRMEAQRTYLTLSHYGNDYARMERTTVKLTGDPDMEELLRAFTCCLVALSFHPESIYRAMAEYALENQPDIGSAN